jgi:phosphatidylserine synthase
VRRAMIAHLLLGFSFVSALVSVFAIFDQAWEQVYGWLGSSLLAEEVRAAFFPPADSDDDETTDTADLNTGLAAISVFCSTVLVPVIALLHAGFLDGYLGIIVGVLVMLTALYRLAYHNTPSRIPEAGPSVSAVFYGMPAVWSFIGFYLHAFDATPPVAVLLIGLAIVLSLAPRNFPHALYSPRWLYGTRAIVACWVLTAAYALYQGFPSTPATKAVLVAVAVYIIVLTALTPQPANGPQSRT